MLHPLGTLQPLGTLHPLIMRRPLTSCYTPLISCCPLQVHPGRGCLVSLLVKVAPTSWRAERVAGGTALHVVATCVMVAGTIGTALAVSSLGVVITLLGAVCSTSVQFILPGAAYFVLFKDPGGCKRWFALAQLLLGLVIMPLCLTLTFLKI